MRLIDADALEYHMLYKENWLKGTGAEEPAVWKKDIDNAPTIYAVPVKHGAWIPDETINGLECIRCSVCNESAIIDCPSSYCPNCGARMEGEDNDQPDR